MRRVIHDRFNIRACPDFYSLQEREAASLVTRLIRDPSRYNDHLGRCTTATMLRTVYGRQGKGASDEKITRGIREFIHRVVSAALPGSYLVDIFPWLMCAPAFLARWKQYGQRWFLHDSQMFESLLTSVREKMVSNIHMKPNYALTRMFYRPSMAQCRASPKCWSTKVASTTLL